MRRLFHTDSSHSSCYNHVVKKLIVLGIIIIIAGLARFLYLGTIPTAISGDELIYPLTAKTVRITGRDISGSWSPLSVFLFRYPPGEQQAELPYFLHLISSAQLPSSLLNVRLLYAALSVGTVILLYLITAELFGTEAGLITGFVAAVNPWLVVMGRTVYENSPATFFYLLGLYILLRNRSWSLLWSIIPFTLAFYSYIGTKLVFVPFVLSASLFAYIRGHKKYPLQLLLLSVFSVLFVGLFVVLLKTNPNGSRLSELFLPSSPEIAAGVDRFRQHSVSTPLTPFIINKYTVYSEIVIGKLFKILSPQYLFVDGDQFFLPVAQSFLYYADSIFILIGTYLMLKKQRSHAVFLLSLILIGTFPQLFHQIMINFSLDLSMMFPFIIIITGYGISGSLSLVRKEFRMLLLGIITVFYIMNISGFVGSYFIQYPMWGGADFPMRILSRYLKETRNSRVPVTVYSPRNGDFLKKYLFYTDGMNAGTIRELRSLDTGREFVFEGIRFTGCDEKATAVSTGVLIYDNECPMTLKGNAHISRLLDGGHHYTILNDTVCRNIDLHQYPSGISLGDFAVESLPVRNFCSIFISQ